MSSDLSHWQQRLTAHFENLASHRNRVREGTPVFALEHGLEATEFIALAEAVRAHIKNFAPSTEHTLPWIVYAAELGYDYSGDEYWQTFEAKTPGWLTHGDRYWIRTAFCAFRSKFSGAEPSGPWADHFSIICWPITHAILPRDLQQQLARILYESRYAYSTELIETPSRLGQFVAARSWNATSRFRNLVQETQLVGQIAAALLLRGEFGTDSLILPITLRRISDDLDRERRTRQWLRDARRSAENQVRGHILPIASKLSSRIANTLEDARTQIIALGIEPRIVLRPISGSGDSWDVKIEIPDLTHLLIKFPQFREILTESRCVVAGTGGRPLAGGRFLHGAQQIVLSRWPQLDEVLLQFEQTDTQLEFILRTECLLRPGTARLFRVASDGLAYEMRSMRVRPGEQYVLVSTLAPFQDNVHARPVDLTCEGAYGVIITLPEALDIEWERTLHALGLGQAKAIEVWPVGLAAVKWDGEGYAEWLSSERPCIAIRTDHRVAALSISMSESVENSLEIAQVEPGEPIFLELPKLPIGLYTIHITERGASESEIKQFHTLDLILRIREARTRKAGLNPHGPLLIQVDPLAPTLEQLWEGRIELTIRGPVGRKVKCCAMLFERNDGAPTATRKIQPIALPVTPEIWRNHFKKHFRDAKDAQRAYDTARVCELELSADELGAFVLRCDREYTPLRWAVRRHDQEYFLRLVDDSGSTEVPSVARFAFETPLVEEFQDLALEYKFHADGGLYVARLDSLTAAIIVPPSVRDPRSLYCSPNTDIEERSVNSISRILAWAHLWGHARLPVDVFSTTRRRMVLHAISRQVYYLLGGEKWSRTEVGIGSNNQEITDLQYAVSKHKEESGLSEALAIESDLLATADRRKCVERLSTLSSKYLTWPPADDPEWLSEFALRLASDISGVDSWAGGNLRRGITYLLEHPTLARAARFLVIATDQHLQSRAISDELYAGWVWP